MPNMLKGNSLHSMSMGIQRNKMTMMQWMVANNLLTNERKTKQKSTIATQNAQVHVCYNQICMQLSWWWYTYMHRINDKW